MKLRNSLLSIVLPLSMIVATVSATGCDDDDRRHRDSSCSSSGGLCADGVGINLEGLTEVFAKAMPLTVTVCFDKSCDEVTLNHDVDGTITCDGKDGGAPDQLTYCEPGDDGLVRFEIARTDGADYGEGARHLIGVSVRTEGKLLWTGTQSTTLSSTVDDGSGACHQDDLTFTPSYGTSVDQPAGKLPPAPSRACRESCRTTSLGTPRAALAPPVQSTRARCFTAWMRSETSPKRSRSARRESCLRRPRRSLGPRQARR